MGVTIGAGHHSAHRGGFLHWIISTFGLLILILVFQYLSNASQSGPVSCATTQCSVPPPQSGPLRAMNSYTSSKYGYSLDYSPTIPPSQKNSTSISWDGTLNDGSEVQWSFLGGKANGRSAQQIVSDVQTSSFPDARQVYVIPGASLGYVSGYGMVYDIDVAPANGQTVHDRLVVMAAIRNGLAVVVAGEGPYQRSTPSNDSHPNPADTPLVHLGQFEESINSVTWPGESPL